MVGCGMVIKYFDYWSITGWHLRGKRCTICPAAEGLENWKCNADKTHRSHICRWSKSSDQAETATHNLKRCQKWWDHGWHWGDSKRSHVVNLLGGASQFPMHCGSHCCKQTGQLLAKVTIWHMVLASASETESFGLCLVPSAQMCCHVWSHCVSAALISSLILVGLPGGPLAKDPPAWSSHPGLRDNLEDEMG